MWDPASQACIAHSVPETWSLGAIAYLTTNLHFSPSQLLLPRLLLPGLHLVGLLTRELDTSHASHKDPFAFSHHMAH